MTARCYKIKAFVKSLHFTAIKKAETDCYSY